MFGFSRKRTQFEQVVEEYNPMLLAYAARLMGNATAAEDLVQDVFIRLARKWTGAMVPSPAMTLWLRTTLRNLAFDRLRTQQRESSVRNRAARLAPESVGPYRGQGGGRLSEDAARAADALASLSAREREVVVLRVYEQKSYKEISAATGLTVGNVGFILHEAMRKLAERLSTKGGAST